MYIEGRGVDMVFVAGLLVPGPDCFDSGANVLDVVKILADLIGHGAVGYGHSSMPVSSMR